jgi:hypothetical protein
MDRKDSGLPVTRRDCLLGGGIGLLAAAQPIAADALPDTRLTRPPGQRKDAPAFRCVALDK